MIIYTNKHNLPAYMVKWLLNDNYDYHPNSFSVSSIIKPTKQHLLSQQVARDKDLAVELDVMDLIASRRGQAIHDAIENANAKDPSEFFTQAQELLRQSITSLHTEQRLTVPVTLDDKTLNITGRFDVLENGILRDVKTERIFSYNDPKKLKDRSFQLSLYAWLCVKSDYNPNIVLDYGYIDSIYSDFTNACINNPKYPNTPIHCVKVNLHSIKEITAYIVERVREYFKALEDPDYLQSIQCTREELWMKNPQYKYFTNESNTKASKVCDSMQEAVAYKNTKGKGKGIIKVVESKANACAYCLGRYACNQYLELDKQGLV